MATSSTPVLTTGGEAFRRDALRPRRLERPEFRLRPPRPFVLERAEAADGFWPESAARPSALSAAAEAFGFTVLDFSALAPGFEADSPEAETTASALVWESASELRARRLAFALRADFLRRAAVFRAADFRDGAFFRAKGAESRPAPLFVFSISSVISPSEFNGAQSFQPLILEMRVRIS
jgi:hypothetical protein